MTVSIARLRISWKLVATPVELAKPNLKLGGIAPFAVARLAMSIRVSPGPVNTELFAAGKSAEEIKRMVGMAVLNRIGEPADIAQVVQFLVSAEAGWITGQNIGANGGIA